MLSAITRWSAGVAALPCLLMFAQTPPPQADASAEVSVRTVRIERVRDHGGWLEAGVQLAVSPGAGGARHADRVRISFAVAYEVDRPRPTTLRCYTAEAEAITLPVGASVIRFYLPPEVIERDRVRSNELHWMVELEQEGRRLPVEPDAVSSSLHSAERLERFKARIASEAPGNAGILVPQYLTPFAYDPQRPSPTCVRRSSTLE